MQIDPLCNFHFTILMIIMIFCLLCAPGSWNGPSSDDDDEAESFGGWKSVRILYFSPRDSLTILVFSVFFYCLLASAVHSPVCALANWAKLRFYAVMCYFYDNEVACWVNFISVAVSAPIHNVYISYLASYQYVINSVRASFAQWSSLRHACRRGFSFLLAKISGWKRFVFSNFTNMWEFNTDNWALMSHFYDIWKKIFLKQVLQFQLP